MTVAVDLFAGWGGFTEAAESVGVKVAWAANHWPLAVEAHARNHPDTTHVCQDLRQADFTVLPKYDLLLASPACQGHSSASQPQRRRYHDVMRATAWAVVDCAEATLPDSIIVENVPLFATWQLFPVWREALIKLGYQIQQFEAYAPAFGVPQRRTRIIIVAQRKRPRTITLPTLKSEPAFGPCLEYASDEHRWKLIADTTDNVKARIAKGRANYGRRFLSQHVTGHPGVPLTEAIRTITTKDQWILVDGDRYRPLTIREHARAMSFPDRYTWPEHANRTDCIKGLGNAVPPKMAAFFVEQVA